MPIIKAGVPDNFMISSGAKTAIQVLSFLLSHPLLCDACHTTQHTDLESLLIYIHDECISRPLFLPQKTQRCVTEFISFITSEVTDSPQFNKTKAITGADILQAMRHLGYEDYALCAEKFGHKWYQNETYSPCCQECGFICACMITPSRKNQIRCLHCFCPEGYRSSPQIWRKKKPAKRRKPKGSWKLS